MLRSGFNVMRVLARQKNTLPYMRAAFCSDKEPPKGFFSMNQEFRIREIQENSKATGQRATAPTGDPGETQGCWAEGGTPLQKWRYIKWKQF